MIPTRITKTIPHTGGMIIDLPRRPDIAVIGIVTSKASIAADGVRNSDAVATP